jgi:hypothetical protein
MTLRWLETLPMPQVNSLRDSAPLRTMSIDVLAGPTRERLTRRHAGGSHEFQTWFTASQAEAFEAWYNQVIALHDGEWYAPWIGHGIVLAFADEYELAPLGLGWALSAMAIQTRVDPSICEEHISAIFGGILRDELTATNVFKSDLSSSAIYRDDYPLKLIAAEPC